MARKLIATILFSVAVLAPILANRQGVSSRVKAEEPDSEMSPRLTSTRPVRSLGESEFRLPRRSSNERMFQFSPDGSLLAACNWNEVKVWTFPDGKLKFDLSDEIDSDCISFSQDGRELLVLDRRDKLAVEVVRFSMTTGKLLRRNTLSELSTQGATDYTFLDHGKWVCAVDNRSVAAIWDANTGRLHLVKPSVRTVRRPIARKDVLTVWDRNYVANHDLRTGDRLSTFNNYQKIIDPICAPDGTVMAGYSTEDKAIVFWRPDTQDRIGGKIPAEQKEWRPNQAALSADGKRFVYWTPNGYWVFDRKMAVFDVETGEILSEFAPPDAYFLEEPVISPDGKWVFPSGERAVFTPVNAETGKPFRDTPDHVLPVEELSFTPDGSTLVVGSRDKRRAWNVATGRPGQVFVEYYHQPYIAAVDNSRALVSGLRDGGIRLQDIATGEVERFYDLGENMHLSKFQLGADRKSFVGQSALMFRRWDIDSGDVLNEWAMPEQRYGAELKPYGRYSFGGLALGGTRLYRFDQVKPGKRLPDKSIEWGKYDLLLEDWTTQQITNRLALPYPGNFAIAESVADDTLAAVAADDWHTRASLHLEEGSTYLMVWDVASGWERMRVELPRTTYFDAFSAITITPDSRLIATVRKVTQVEIWNGFTGELMQRFEAPIDVTKLAFSNDGTILASGHIEGSVHLWDTREACSLAIPVVRLSEAEAEQCWVDLAGKGTAPSVAMQKLRGDPQAAMALFKKNLKPSTTDLNIEEEIAALLDLNDVDADAKAKALGPAIVDGLYEILEQIDSEDSKSRIERLIAISTSPVNSALRRRLLAVNVTEHIKGVEAGDLLKAIADGARSAPETKAANAALVRRRD
ncbi:MAG: WD40 repeat domain-containing protein [Planctomycetales bacterium]|nr:WD40 repeat domain-containing protein [Planctomycetales bacterium]